MSQSTASTFLPLSAKQAAVFAARKVLPLPTLNEVNRQTLQPRAPSPASMMNSRLVRSTLKASLTTLRLPWRITISPLCSSASFFLRARERRENLLLRPPGTDSGISPANGRVRSSRSLRPRTLVFMLSSR